MKSLKYIWRNMRRNKLRSALTIISIGFSLALLTVLIGYLALQEAARRDSEKHNRVVVMNIQGFSGAVPLAHLDRVKRFDGILAAAPYAWFGGNYGDNSVFFAQVGTDAEQVFEVWDDYSIDAEQLRQWQSNRQGCVADRRLAARMGWEIGERIPIQGTYYPVNLELDLVGIFDTPQPSNTLFFHWEYLDELVKKTAAGRGSGNVGIVFAKVDPASNNAEVAAEIDKWFASSDFPTKSQTEAAFAKMFADMSGNIQLFITYIGLAVVISLMLVTGNTMAMSIRERTTEIAVLKALGFTSPRVLWMVLGESCGIALLGGLVGVLLGCLFLESIHRLLPDFFPFGISAFAGPWLLGLMALAGAIGLISGVAPAVGAARLSVVDGLRRVI